MEEKTTFTFTSDERSSGTNSAPVFTLNNAIRLTKSIAVGRVQIPASIYNITAVNQTMVIDYDVAVDVNVTIPVGSYDATGLATAMKTAMDAATGGVFTVTYDPQTFRFTWSLAVLTFRIKATGSISNVIGVSTTPALGATQTADDAANLFLKPISIVCNELTNGRTVRSWHINGEEKGNLLIVVNPNSSHGGLIEYDHLSTETVYKTTPYDITKVSFRLEDPDGASVDLNELPWSIDIIGHFLE